ANRVRVGTESPHEGEFVPQGDVFAKHDAMLFVVPARDPEFWTRENRTVEPSDAVVGVRLERAGPHEHGGIGLGRQISELFANRSRGIAPFTGGHATVGGSL